MWLSKNKKSLIWVKFFANKLVNDFYIFIFLTLVSKNDLLAKL